MTTAAGARVVADTHVHLYPGYDLPAALTSLAGNLSRTPAGAHAAFFAERRDCRAFAALREGAARPLAPGIAVQALANPAALLLSVAGASPVFLFAGRQVATAERIEVLALAVDLDIADGLPAERVVDDVLAAGGVPVLGWSPGKWWFARGRLARGLLERCGRSLLLGDTALRPATSGEPQLMLEARRRGTAILAGTDPLPLPGEERLLGRYASVLAGSIDPDHPVESARQLLRSATSQTGTTGNRSTWAAAARRWLYNRQAA